MNVADVRTGALRQLDGMTINRDLFARQVLALCNAFEAQHEQIQRMQQDAAKTQVLLDQYDAQIKALKEKSSAFSDIFKTK